MVQLNVFTQETCKLIKIWNLYNLTYKFVKLEKIGFKYFFPHLYLFVTKFRSLSMSN